MGKGDGYPPASLDLARMEASSLCLLELAGDSRDKVSFSISYSSNMYTFGSLVYRYWVWTKMPARTAPTVLRAIFSPITPHPVTDTKYVLPRVYLDVIRTHFAILETWLECSYRPLFRYPTVDWHNWAAEHREFSSCTKVQRQPSNQ